MTDDDLIQGIRQAAANREQASSARREAVEQLRYYVRHAQAQGVPITRIAAEAGLSRRGVYDLLAVQPS